MNIIVNTEKYVAEVENRLGRQQYTINALSKDEAIETAKRNLIDGTILISVKLSNV